MRKPRTNKSRTSQPRTSQPRTTKAQSPCRLYDRRACTGCVGLHEPYARQLAAKEAFVADTLAPVLGTDRKAWLRPIVPSPQPLGWRASAKLCLDESREGWRSVGLYRGGTREVVATPGCPAQAGDVNRIVSRLFARDVRLPGRLYDHGGRVFQKKRLKFLIVRCAPGAGEAGAGIIVAHTGVEKAALISWLKSAGLGNLCAYETRLTAGDGDELMGRHIDHLSGPEFFRYPLAGQTYALAPAAFFQANHALGPALITAATDFAAPGDMLLDLYGGFGAYSFPSAARFQKIAVVDGNSAAIDAARRTAKERGITHLEAHAAMCEEFLESGLAAADAKRVTHVIVNPPRNGLSRRVITALGRGRLPGLMELRYVSCNPSTLARDLDALVALGLVVRDVQPFDMFPQTEHVEVVARILQPRP